MSNTAELVEAAIKAASYAYAPYSNFSVGAALVCGDKKIYQGCNIENVSFGLTNCAERTAIFKAISYGSRDFCALYIYGETEIPISPCGACRQVMREFCQPEMPVYLISKEKCIKETTIGELLPYSFTDLH